MNIIDVQMVFERSIPIGVRSDGKFLNIITVIISVTLVASIVYLYYNEVRENVKKDDPGK